MLPSASPSTTAKYFPLTSSTSNDLSRHCEPSALISISRTSPKHTTVAMRNTFLIRMGAFTIIESGFIVPGIFAMKNPIPIYPPIDVTLPEAKSAFTTIFVIWHALAVFLAKDIVLHILTAEWIEQYRKSGNIVPGKTDVVSRMTSGIIDQTKHFGSRVATLSFRLCFACLLLFMLLHGIGPSAITVNLLEHPHNIKIANLTVKRGNQFAWRRASLAVSLEQVGLKGTYGLIPWPSSELISAGKIIRYQTDIISYNFSCSWKQPMANGSMSSWIIDNQGWNVFLPPPDADLKGTLMDSYLVPPASFNASHTAFLFIGSNTTLSQNVKLDLEGIPTKFIPPNRDSMAGNNTSPVLVSALVCDPRPHVSSATAVLSGISLWIDGYHDHPRVKNIPRAAVNAIFSDSLLTAASPIRSGRFNIIACILFLNPSCERHYKLASGIKPLSLDKINQQMNTILLSSAKVYLSGSMLTGTNPTSSATNMMETKAVEEAQELALVASTSFLIVLIIVVGVVILLLCTLMVMARVDHLQTFDLENIVKILKAV
ncbi:hypothetical protein P691DRAFT_781814 [Macrolepiota fuliginosa MF-IS2]|uniref:Transmembrane protein n=1 Tax=Macrolepiota fuliginosa MF-IS2 TaxID=1400762 RepID=A0A9P5X0E9_9AGAR|nr:hypothetical protein P691DRAFT_781814 [Macrolepiota fuliginosa MF-IS2]